MRLLITKIRFLRQLPYGVVCAENATEFARVERPPILSLGMNVSRASARVLQTRRLRPQPLPPPPSSPLQRWPRSPGYALVCPAGWCVLPLGAMSPVLTRCVRFLLRPAHRPAVAANLGRHDYPRGRCAPLKAVYGQAARRLVPLVQD